MADNLVYSKDRNLTLAYDDSGKLVGKLPGKVDSSSFGAAMESGMSDVFPTLNKFSHALSPGNMGSGDSVAKDLLPDMPEFGKGTVTDIASALPFLIPGGGKLRTAAKVGGSLAAGTAADQLLSPDKSITSSFGEAGLNTLLASIAPMLFEKAGIKINPRTTTSTTTHTPSVRESETIGSSKFGKGVIKRTSNTTGSSTTGDSTTVTQGPHQGWLGNIMDALSSIELAPAMKNNVSKSGYVYPKAVQVQYSPVERLLMGLGFNTAADFGPNRADKK